MVVYYITNLIALSYTNCEVKDNYCQELKVASRSAEPKTSFGGFNILELFQGQFLLNRIPIIIVVKYMEQQQFGLILTTRLEHFHNK